MASSKAGGTGNKEPEFFLPSGYTETQSARAYWGHSLVPEISLNHRLSSLVVGLLDFAHATTGARPPASAAAVGCIMPETFSAVVALFSMRYPEWGPPEAVAELGASFFDEIFEEYYNAYNMDTVCGNRSGTGVRKCLPLIQRKTVHLWLRKFIEAYPDEMWTRFNIILRDLSALIDPITEAPFEEKIIPRSCFPIKPITSVYDSVLSALEDYNRSKEKIILKVQLYLSQQQAQQAQQQHQAQQQQQWAQLLQRQRLAHISEQNQGYWKITSRTNEEWDWESGDQFNGGWMVSPRGRRRYVSSLVP